MSLSPIEWRFQFSLSLELSLQFDYRLLQNLSKRTRTPLQTHESSLCHFVVLCGGVPFLSRSLSPLGVSVCTPVLPTRNVHWWEREGVTDDGSTVPIGPFLFVLRRRSRVVGRPGEPKEVGGRCDDGDCHGRCPSTKKRRTNGSTLSGVSGPWPLPWPGDDRRSRLDE